MMMGYENKTMNGIDDELFPDLSEDFINEDSLDYLLGHSYISHDKNF